MGWFSNLFFGRTQSSALTVPQRKKRDVEPTQGLKRTTGEAEIQGALKNATREVHGYDKAEQELGMTDLIKQHKPGDRFLYAAVTADQGEEASSKLRRLINFQPKLLRRPIPVGKLPNIALFEEVEAFNLSNILPPKKGTNVRTYILISEVLVIYGSLISTDSAFSKVRVSIIDDRLLNNKIAKSYIANTNMISKATMQLSYCFPRDEVDAISLTLAREAAFLEEGRQWGVAQVMIKLEETEFPIQLSNAAVLAVHAIPQAVLEDKEVNPDLLDITIEENNRRELRDMYMNGDVSNETEPVTARTEAVSYAKSSLAGPRGKKPEFQQRGEWGFMDQSRAGMPAGANSVEPSEEGSISTMLPRPILKRPRPPTPPASPPSSEDTMEISRDVAREVPRRVVVQDPSDNFLSMP